MKKFKSIAIISMFIFGSSTLAMGGDKTGYHSDRGMDHSTSKTSKTSWDTRRSAQFSTAQVKEAQRMLRDEGHYNGRIDGIAGPNTTQALERYQRDNGLRVTGTLNSQTMGQMGVPMKNETYSE